MQLHSQSELSSGQRRVVEHLLKCNNVFLQGLPPQLPAASVSAQLQTKNCSSYIGEPVSILRTLFASKVIPAWPKPGMACMFAVETLLDGELKEDVLDLRRCLLPPEEWPHSPPRSKVHASDAEWYKLCKAGLELGIFEFVAESEIFRDQHGRMVLNGAMGVDKEKDLPDGTVLDLLRFISILCPINAYMRRLRGDVHALPYLHQLSLILLGPEEHVMINSQDLGSCANILRMPKAWLGMFAFEKRVPGSVVLGGSSNELKYVAIRCLPMGFAGAADIVQAWIRAVVFGNCDVAESTEVRKDRRFPTGPDFSVLYFDGFDYLRVLASSIDRMLVEQPPEQRRFVDFCVRHGLPLNESKELIAALRGGVLGGLLNGELGLLALTPAKAASLWWKSLALASSSSWTQNMLRHWCGGAVFACGFRRPIFSVLQEVFHQICELETGPSAAWRECIDEVLSLAVLLPFCHADLRAPMRKAISCTDASEAGGGSAEAKHFKATLCPLDAVAEENARSSLAEESQTLPYCSACDVCSGQFLSAPAGCCAGCPVCLCSIHCVLEHRRSLCTRAVSKLPVFVEGFTGADALLTWTCALRGIEVGLPLDKSRRPYTDPLSARGSQHVRAEFDYEFTAWEHWGCADFSPAVPRVRNLHFGGEVASNRDTQFRVVPTAQTGTRDLPAQVRAARDRHMPEAALSLQRLCWRLVNWGIAVVPHP